MADPVTTFIDVAGEPTDAAVGGLQRLLASIDARLRSDGGLTVTMPRYGVGDPDVLYIISATGLIHLAQDDDVEQLGLPIDPDQVERVIEERGPAGSA